MRRTMQSGSYMDMGMFIQSVMLAACEQGLATCPQAALAEYPDIVRDALDVGDDYMVLCGMALGYEDSSAPVNNYRTPREPVSGFTRFLD
jgi:nitroreductase